MGVVIKNGFSNQVPVWQLDMAVALATGAPYFANLLSAIWVRYAQGRGKALMVSRLALVFCALVLLLSQVPFNGQSLWLMMTLLIGARICWSGIITIRAAIWRDNFPRHIRAQVTGVLATLASITMALSGFLAGWLLQWSWHSFVWLYSGFALVGIIGAIPYGRLSVRHQQKRLSGEKARDGFKFSDMLYLLKNNKPFARYMLAMFVLGSGNLMFMAPLISFINESTEIGRQLQIAVTSAIPLAMIPLFVRYWARLLDRNHVFKFRAVHAWSFVLAILVYFVAQLCQWSPLYIMAAVFYGIAIAGGAIGWNLGHNDFVGKGNPLAYMAVHVTLTGVRGLLMPLVGVSFYRWCELKQPGAGQYALALPLIITSCGAILFTYFYRRFRDENR